MTKEQRQPHRVGVISDTHGILQPQVVDLFAGCDLIIHAGDIDIPEILTKLRRIAPVTAVRGNMDRGSWAGALPVADMVTVGDMSIYVLHDLANLNVDPRSADIQVLISGHTHKAEKKKEAGVLYVNPGSAGAPRSDRQPSVALLYINGQSIHARLVRL